MTTLQCDCKTIFRVDRGVICDNNQLTIPCPDCQRPVRTKNMSDGKQTTPNTVEPREDFTTKVFDALEGAIKQDVDLYALIGFLNVLSTSLSNRVLIDAAVPTPNTEKTTA